MLKIFYMVNWAFMLSEMEAEDHIDEDVENASSDSITDSDGSIESENDRELHPQVSFFFVTSFIWSCFFI